jgi:gliding motility-associated-like protein
MKKIFTLLILFTALYTNAQIVPEIQWQTSLGSEEADISGGITPTSDGGYIAFGNVIGLSGNVTTFNGFSDYWIAKLDADGVLEWERSYGGSGYEGAASDGFLRIETSKIRQTADGGYILGANSWSSDGDVSANFGGSDAWLVKLDSSGNIEWEQNYGTDGDEYFTDIKVTDDGGYIMTHFTVDWNTLIFNSTITKLDTQGNTEWANAYGEGLYIFSSLYGVSQTSDGGYIATGTTDAEASATTPANEVFPGFNDPNSRLWVLKISATGGFEWAKTYGGSSIDEGYCITEDPDGNFVVTGMTYSGDGDVVGHPNANNTPSAWVLKLDSTGELLWERTFGEGAGAVDVAVMPDGNYVVGGNFLSNMEANGQFVDTLGEADEYLKKLDQATGNAVWTKTMGGTLQDVLWGFELAPDGGFIVTGASRSSNGDATGNIGDFDYWVVKLGPDCVVPVLTAQTAYTVCSGNDLTLSAASDGNIINWYASETSTAILFTGTDFVVPAVTADASYWVEAVSPTGCTAQRTEVTVSVTALPVLTVATTAYTICENTTVALTAAAAPGNIIAWYDSADATTPIASGTAFTTPVLTADTSYWAEASDPLTTCVSARIEVTVEVTPLPIVTVDTVVSVCNNTAATLTATTATGNIISWYDSANATAPIAAGTVFTTPALTANTSYWVEVSNPQTNCVSDRTEIAVTVTPLPALTVATTVYNTCENTTALLTAATTTGNLIVWYDSATATQPVANGAEFTTPALTQNTSYWVQAYDPQTHCVSDRTEVTITITPGSLAIVGFSYTDASVCVLGNNPSFVADAGFNWGGTFSSASGLSINAATGEIDLSSSDAGIYTVTYTFATSGCLLGGSHSADITIADPVTPVVSFNYGEICTNDTSADPVLGSGFTEGGTFSAASGLSVDAVTGAIDVTQSTPGTYLVVYQLEEDVDTCTPAGRFESTVGINICQIQRGISPNGDDLNDRFDLTGLDVRQLSIYNRYGTEIYVQSDYVKEWAGQDKDGKELPTGTYFYAIEKTSGDNVTGWIYINREN